MSKRKVKEGKDQDKPWVSNYPPLADWLDKHNARCMWQMPSSPAPEHYRPDWAPQFYIEGWLVGRGVVILIVRGNRMGWEIYSAPNTNRIDETLADTEKRLGIGADDPIYCINCGWIIAPDGVYVEESHREGAALHRCDDTACVAP